MLSRIVAVVALLAAASVCAPGGATAQNGTQLQIGGGMSIPVARFDSNYTSGPAGLIAISTGGTESQFGFRLDYSYNGFTGKTIGGKHYRNAHMNVVTGDVVYSLPTGPYVKPYVLLGAGWYPFREATDSKRRNDSGANLGAGLTFPLPLTSYGGFIEARYHRVFGGGAQARRFVPIVMGVTL